MPRIAAVQACPRRVGARTERTGNERAHLNALTNASRAHASEGRNFSLTVRRLRLRRRRRLIGSIDRRTDGRTTAGPVREPSLNAHVARRGHLLKEYKSTLLSGTWSPPYYYLLIIQTATVRISRRAEKQRRAQVPTVDKRFSPEATNRIC